MSRDVDSGSSKRDPRASASPPIPDISLRRTARRLNRLTRDEARAARSCCGGMAPCLCADHSWCHPLGYRWRKPAFPTMSGGPNGTPYHDRQTDLSPQRAPGVLDLIAAVQRGDKIIMTFEETMTKLWFCALAVHPYAEICPSAFLRRLFAIISAMRSR
jgi:hypothetical protein